MASTWNRESLIQGLKAQHPSIQQFALEALVDLWLKNPDKVKELAREDQIKQAKLARKKPATRTLEEIAAANANCLMAGAVEVTNPEEKCEAIVVDDEPQDSVAEEVDSAAA